MGDKRLTNSLFVWLVATLAFTAIYFLSIGPAILLRESGAMSRDAFFTIYAPVILLYKTVPGFGAVIEMYANLWLAMGRLFGMQFPNVANP